MGSLTPGTEPGRWLRALSLQHQRRDLRHGPSPASAPWDLRTVLGKGVAGGAERSPAHLGRVFSVGGRRGPAIPAEEAVEDVDEQRVKGVHGSAGRQRARLHAAPRPRADTALARRRARAHAPAAAPSAQPRTLFQYPYQSSAEDRTRSQPSEDATRRRPTSLSANLLLGPSPQGPSSALSRPRPGPSSAPPLKVPPLTAPSFNPTSPAFLSPLLPRAPSLPANHGLARPIPSRDPPPPSPAHLSRPSGPISSRGQTSWPRPSPQPLYPPSVSLVGARKPGARGGAVVRGRRGGLVWASSSPLRRGRAAQRPECWAIALSRPGSEDGASPSAGPCTLTWVPLRQR